MTEELTSPEQDSWSEISEAIRMHIRKRAELLPAMKPDEVKTFIESAQSALWLEKCSVTYDVEVEQIRRRFFYSD